ncbi:MAG: hypothetical protein R3C39_02340 [Dehalococcoidia bacterium]
MNERIWEGLIQVLRKDEAPLTATARLWRRDDFFGTDWGGQLELPIALRRALPPGEYTIVLAPGREAVAFVGLGPSNAASTFPTVTGTSAPPFGAAPAEVSVEEPEDAEDETPIAELVAEAEEDGAEESLDAAETNEAADELEADDEADAAESDDEEPEDVEEEAAPAPKARAASRSNARKRPARAAASRAAPKAAQPPPKAEAPQAAAPIEESPAEPVKEPTVAEAAPTTPAVEAITPLPFVAPGVSMNGHSAEGIARTERLARAFLAAVDTRQRMQAVNATGVEGHLFASARTLVEELAGFIESRLRGSNESVPWLGQRLAAVEWFGATIASMPDRPDLVEVGQSLTRLAGVVHTTVSEPQAVAA